MATLNKDTASEYDFVIGLDASGSMGSPSTRYAGKSRWEEAQETVTGIANAIGKYDADGIDVVVFGGNVEVHNNVTSAKVADLFANRSPRGGTPLAQALQKVVEAQAKTQKNTVAIFFTDGEPDDKMAAVRTIIEASKKIDSDEKLTFLFVQIGGDAGATKFLQALDDDLQAAGAKFDIVDTVTGEEADGLEPLDLINKAISD